jgi:HlyD family secretion protein
MTLAQTHQPQPFEQPILLRQSSKWSRAIALGITGLAGFVLIWAAVFQLEEAVPAAGKLEPQSAVKEVQAPIEGVVRDVLVKDGQRVKKGELLIRFDTTAAKAQVESQQKIRAALVQEMEFYRNQLRGKTLSTSPEMAALQRSRTAILTENNLYRAQLGNSAATANLNSDQQLRLHVQQTELDSRLRDAQLNAQQITRQLQQNQIQLKNAQETLKINQNILDRFTPLATQGGISQVQFAKQQQTVLESQSQVDQFLQEGKRLELAIAQAQEKARQAVAASQQEILTKIATNERAVADTDIQATKTILENQKRIAEIDTQLSQAKLTLQYQELRAPADGTVFELKATSPGYVANPSIPVLKIVPTDSLVAQVDIANKDIGFVKEGMEVNVKLDSFPFQEFGDIKGELIWIGSDALPPDQLHQYYRFPAKIRLHRQAITANGREISLQSGMSLNANIKLRKRTVLSLFTDLFIRQTESLKFIR